MKKRTPVSHSKHTQFTTLFELHALKEAQRLEESEHAEAFFGGVIVLIAVVYLVKELFIERFI